MWSIDLTTRLLKEMSRSTEPGQLVRLYFEHLRQNFGVQRVLVLSNAGLSRPHYRLVHNVHCNDAPSGSVVTMDEVRQGGLLARMLYLGEFQNIPHFVPDASDPAFDLLEGGGPLVALPFFEHGSIGGMVVALGSSARPPDSAELCIWATISSLLGRAIESQKLANQLKIACDALDSELRAAAEVQRWLLPPSMPEVARTSVAASYRTARHSGGDYYDLGEMPDGRLGVLIADVCGKGAAAAVLMVVLRTIVHETIQSRVAGPAALLDYLDSRLCALGLPQRYAFITAFACALDPATGTLTYSSAGHNPPRVLRARERSVIPLDGARSLPLGAVDEPDTHTEETIVLMPGDLTLLYTDGITEAMSPEHECFSEDRLDQILRDLTEPTTPDMAIAAVAKAVAQFAGDGAPSDDQTLLALARRTGSGDLERHGREGDAAA